MKRIALPLIFLVQVYRWVFSPAKMLIFGSNARCRYLPTCSMYALTALKEHGAVSGSWLAVKRLCRCHPWGGCGCDPVPPVHEGNAKLISPISNH